MDKQRERKISKNLSWILRHAAPKLKLTILPNGYVPLEEVLALPQLAKDKVTLSEIMHIVNSNDKKRFNIAGEGSELLICANQGHSFKVETDDLKVITLDDIWMGRYPVVLHGTYLEVLPQIEQEGLKRMKRNHIHMAKGKFGEVVSGVRGSVEILIYIDIESAVKDGLSFWESRNGVILCEGPIPPNYFLKIERVNEAQDPPSQ